MLPYLENDLADAQFLHGDWEFRLGNAPPMLVSVPAAWEAYGHDKLTDGPAFYRRVFNVPGEWLGKRIVLEAHAISFDATIRVNGRFAGHHRGMWSPFQVDLTPFVQSGENRLEIEVWKPGTRFPMRESLAGFLPDVCTAFGGIWQDILLRAFDRVALHDIKFLADASGHVEAHGRFALLLTGDGLGVSRGLSITLDILDSHTRLIASALSQLQALRAPFSLMCDVPDVDLWQPDAPHAYSATVSLLDGAKLLARTTRQIGFRDVTVREGKTWLNSKPLHVRGVLHWGWDQHEIRPALKDFPDQIHKARALGFNLIKLCLFIPPEPVFQVADDLGLLLWLEMPMWLPRVTPELRQLALSEYREVFARLHHHPSIAILSLGCELNSAADADFLRALYDLAREWFPNALICDNSGSAEAYSGVLTGLGDFYDYHFYTDPHFFPALVDHFDRAYQPAKPWIYGEFCDADTLRDFGQLDPQAWWLTDSTPLDRDDFLYTRDYQHRLSAAGVTDEGAALTHIARRQGTAIRKFILEHVRSRSAAGGYVVTGWADTPITSSGVVDDGGHLKFSPDEWRQFNADHVLTMDRERRRRWVGGDRPAHKDPFTWWQGERAEVHILLSNGGEALERGRLDWRLATMTGSEVAGGTSEANGIGDGEVREIAVLSFKMPDALTSRPLELVLSVTWVRSDGFSHSRAAKTAATIRNSWRLWAVPKPRLPALLAVADPLQHHHNFARIDREARFVSLKEVEPGQVPLIAGELTAEVLAWVRAGGFALLWQREPDRRFIRPVPFWREVIHVFEPHPLWDNVPHPGHADLRFFGVATDFAVDLQALHNVLGATAHLRPIWRRFDARAMTWAEYVLEARVGAGRLLVSLLRFEGGLGYQPDSFDTNPWGAWLLALMLGAGGV